MGSPSPSWSGNEPSGLLRVVSVPLYSGLVVGEVDLQSWFADHELERCPCCTSKSAVSTPRGGFRICLECGLLNPYGEPVGDVTRALAPKCSSAAAAPDSVALGESR